MARIDFALNAIFPTPAESRGCAKFKYCTCAFLDANSPRPVAADDADVRTRWIMRRSVARLKASVLRCAVVTVEGC
jgi:hypothetical protein